MKENSYK